VATGCNVVKGIWFIMALIICACTNVNGTGLSLIFFLRGVLIVVTSYNAKVYIEVIEKTHVPAIVTDTHLVYCVGNHMLSRAQRIQRRYDF
jgi:TM2 domain-containing membrane protein YozV